MDDSPESKDAHAGSTPPARTRWVISERILDLDHVYDALGHPRRRYLLYTLKDELERPLSDIARAVAAWENDLSEGMVTDEQHERTYVSLYHAHVPKLEDEGIITFDQASETIGAGRHADQVLSALAGMGSILDAGRGLPAQWTDEDAE